ncbi:hypothetical protein ACLOJK_010666 [Asimina triloba]
MDLTDHYGGAYMTPFSGCAKVQEAAPRRRARLSLRVCSTETQNLTPVKRERGLGLAKGWVCINADGKVSIIGSFRRLGFRGAISKECLRERHRPRRRQYPWRSLFELILAGMDDNLMTYRLRCLCVNEHMFKAGVGLPFEYDIAEAFIMALVAPIQLVPNWAVTWFAEWLEVASAGGMADRAPHSGCGKASLKGAGEGEISRRLSDQGIPNFSRRMMGVVSETTGLGGSATNSEEPRKRGGDSPANEEQIKKKRRLVKGITPEKRRRVEHEAERSAEERTDAYAAVKAEEALVVSPLWMARLGPELASVGDTEVATQALEMGAMEKPLTKEEVEHKFDERVVSDPRSKPSWVSEERC